MHNTACMEKMRHETKLDEITIFLDALWKIFEYFREYVNQKRPRRDISNA